ncbi:MAG: cell division protein FtsQ/DivIB [Thermoleophilaceae bacterium]
MRTAATVALRAVPRAALALPPAWRRRLAIALTALAALGALYVAWFRDSSFARVHDVHVTGLEGPQSHAIRSALENAGLDMTTLHVREGTLRDAVADFPIVRSVTAQGDFPHVLRVEVQLNLPVALIQTAAGKFPVAADGLVLRDVPITPGLPLLATAQPAPPERIAAGAPFELLRVVAAAPPTLRPRIRRVEITPASGLVARMRRGPDLIFGDASRMAAKWTAAARVLASPAAKGATYIDLRLPARPAAGGLPTTGLVPLAPAGRTAPVPPTTATPQPSTTTTAPAPTATQPTPAPTQTAPAATQTTPATTAPAPAQPAPAATTGGGIQAAR